MHPRFNVCLLALLTTVACNASISQHRGTAHEDGRADDPARRWSDAGVGDARAPSTSDARVSLAGDGSRTDAASLPGSDICGNGLDDNRNGTVDESCACPSASTQACWPGLPTQRGQGLCRDGVQRCPTAAVGQEFVTWLACEGASLPGTEIAGNCIDEDCDGNMPGCQTACSEYEDCGNGVDDTCNGMTDCLDPQCLNTAACRPTTCVPSAVQEFSCTDGRDDDCDTRTDCEDTDCSGTSTCAECGPGMRLVYRAYWPGAGPSPIASTRSNISGSSGQPIYRATCEPGSCGPGNVGVLHNPASSGTEREGPLERAGSGVVCAAPPPTCTGGSSAWFNPQAASWSCETCTYVVQYGYMWNNERICTRLEPPACDAPEQFGQVPWFIRETETWTCREPCDNNLYDQVQLPGSGRIVCVPC